MGACTFDASGLGTGGPGLDPGEGDDPGVTAPGLPDAGPGPQPSPPADEPDAGAPQPPEPDAPTLLPFGAVCREDEDCESGECHDFKGPKKPRCTEECENDADCPSGSRCEWVSGGKKMCSVP